MIINRNEIDNGFEYYNLNSKYKNRCYECLKMISENEEYLLSFENIFEQLNYGDFKSIRKYWDFKNVNQVFDTNIDPFATNLLIVLSYKNHEKNMQNNKLDSTQVLIHKKRIKECFENDLEKRRYESVRVSQMLWAIYFIRVKIIEIGRLQYEYFKEDDNELIKIHIPLGDKLDYNKVIESLNKSKDVLTNIFNTQNISYVCNSWLLSKKLNCLINSNTNISKFYNLFNVVDGEECTDDILNFVYSLKQCNDYTKLPEETSIQRLIKKQLLNGVKFKLGKGILKNNILDD